MKALDLLGQRFGRLLVIGKGPTNRFNHSTWKCLCDCGMESVTETQKLRSGHSQSCGCAFREKIGKVQFRHGACVGELTPEYRSWSAMIDRCENSRSADFADYGGRGIRVCDRWRQDFAAFRADMGPRPKGSSIDRLDNDRGYEPENCAWRTPRQQARNKRNTLRVTLPDGSLVVLSEYAELHGVDYHCMYARHIRGQPLLKDPQS
jgi:hypothetical protein